MTYLIFFAIIINYNFLKGDRRVTEILEWIYQEVFVDSYIIRMLVASLCGGFIGLERSRRQKDAGIRTHMIVALGAAMIIIVIVTILPACFSSEIILPSHTDNSSPIRHIVPPKKNALAEFLKIVDPGECLFINSFFSFESTFYSFL